MKKGKRLLAVLCCLVMTVGSIQSGNGVIVNASESSVAEDVKPVESKYYLIENESEKQSSGSDTASRVMNKGTSVRLSDVAKWENLKLCINVTVADDTVLSDLAKATVELAQEQADKAELQWNSGNSYLTADKWVQQGTDTNEYHI